MKLLKILPVLSLIFAVAFSLCAVSTLGMPSGIIGGSVAPKSNGISTAAVTSKAPSSNAQIAVIGVAKAEELKPALDIDKITEIINSNRVFDDFIYDIDALIDEAQFALIDEAETIDGEVVIKRETVDSFVAELYGREIEHEDDDAEYYTVSDHDYISLKQQVISAEEGADGTVTVTACMLCGESEDEVAVTTLLAPAENSFGYIVLSAQINE